VIKKTLRMSCYNDLWSEKEFPFKFRNKAGGYRTLMTARCGDENAKLQ